MNRFEKRIVLSAGGTGGHMFPAQALAHQLSAQGYKIYIFSDDRGYDFKDPLFSMIRIPSGSLQGSVRKKLNGSYKLIRGMGAAIYHLQSIQPHAVIGFGGYASFPTLLAASIRRLPTIIHQADAYFGRTNRFLAPFVTRIATSFPYVKNISKSHINKISFTGLPLRSEIQPAAYIPSLESDPFHLLVTGGSQGAKIFGEIIPKAIQLLDSSLQRRLHISQQCRIETLASTQLLYAQTQATVELAPFLDNMGARYKKAHFIIGRSGASSVLEIALVGRPGLFIPYPYAMNNHQFYNAEEVMKVKGGWMMQEKELTSQSLAAFLSELMTSHWKLSQAAVNILKIVIPDASERLANLVKTLTN